MFGYGSIRARRRGVRLLGALLTVFVLPVLTLAPTLSTEPWPSDSGRPVRSLESLGGVAAERATPGAHDDSSGSALVDGHAPSEVATLYPGKPSGIPLNFELARAAPGSPSGAAGSRGIPASRHRADLPRRSGSHAVIILNHALRI